MSAHNDGMIGFARSFALALAPSLHRVFASVTGIYRVSYCNAVAF